MASHTLHIFNPEHDFSLAVGDGPYTVPAKVEKLKFKNALLPAYYACNSDFILIPDNIVEEDLKELLYYEEVKQKNLRLISSNELQIISHQIGEIMPWGWDYSIKRFLKENGIPESLLPGNDFLNHIRILSHRRTVIPFRETINRKLGKDNKIKAKELFKVEEVEEFLISNPLSYFKAPWSSSGRGIVVSDHISRKGLLEWSHGIIRRQGSVIAEASWDRVFDFATEWIIKENNPFFLGYSVFEVSSRGKYHRNIKASQDSLFRLIKKNVPEFNKEIIEAQEEALKAHIAPYYSGPLGIDMLADSNGDINSCVEINLRLTMGLIELIKPDNKI